MSIQHQASIPVIKPFIPHAPTRFQNLIAWILFLVERVLTSTLRFRFVGKERVIWNSNESPRIFCLWHNRLALCMLMFRQVSQYTHASRKLAALVSASKDGAQLAAILKRFGVDAVRGSSSRRGARAMFELVSAARRGFDLAITPDGPRGPRYTIQDGVLTLAQLTGSAIIPVSYQCSRVIRIKSWDQFQIPLPFSRCDFRIGAPIRIPRKATQTELESFKLQLRNELLRLGGDPATSE